jgi:DtxR family Mn-dependent transcriptional regulator
MAGQGMRRMKNQVWKTFAAQEVSHSMAHYLTSIQDLHERRGYARVSDVARELQLTKGSVSIQIKHLKEKGFVNEDENRFLHLTASGEAVARDVCYNRQVLFQFLNRVLGVQTEKAETDACKIEHLLSRETSRQILVLVQFLQSDDPAARKFVEKLKGFKVGCPTSKECSICEDRCLAELDASLDGRSICPASLSVGDNAGRRPRKPPRRKPAPGK